MYTIKGRIRFKILKAATAIALGATLASTALAEPPPQTGSSADSAHAFLTFSAGKSSAENPVTAHAYMNAIDPGQTKLNFKTWLVKAGFIQNEAQWTPSGQQRYTDIPGDYGVGVINAYSHIIILNAADLGFIRNQYIRCSPNCQTPNAKIYTYLENYGAQQTTTDASGHTVTFNNSPVSVQIALEKRPVDLADPGHRIADVAFEWAPASNHSNPTHNFGQIYPYVIIPEFSNFVCGVGFSNPINDSLGNQIVDEQYYWPVGAVSGVNQAFYDCAFNSRPKPIPQFSAGAPDPTHIEFLKPPPDFKIIGGDVFAPELDALGTKQNPGVCLMCHGGNIPSTLATTQSWGPTGEISEFKFLPADAVNSIFGVDDTVPITVNGTTLQSPLVPGTRLNGDPNTASNQTEGGQAAEVRKYNQAVALTHGALPPKNATISPIDLSIVGTWSVGRSPDHALQVIFGWYQRADGDYSMSGPITQNRFFVPVGWRGATGANLYSEVIQRDCRSCHLNREPSLDFRTQAQFDGNQGNIQDWVFQPECDFLLGQVNPRNIVMPASRLSWERLWNGILGVNAPFGSSPEPYALPQFGVIDNEVMFGIPGVSAPANVVGPGTTPKTSLDSDINLLKAHFGYTPTSYCASHH
jgi:hypothetical protein